MTVGGAPVVVHNPYQQPDIRPLNQHEPMSTGQPLLAQQVQAPQAAGPADAYQLWYMQQFYQKSIGTMIVRSDFGLEDLRRMGGYMGDVGEALQSVDQQADHYRQAYREWYADYMARFDQAEQRLDTWFELQQQGGDGRPVTVEDLTEYYYKTRQDMFENARASLEMSFRLNSMSREMSKGSLAVSFVAQVSQSLQNSVRRLTDGT